MDDYSKHVRGLLLAEFPGFAPYAREVEGGSLLIEIPPPEPVATPGPLCVDTHGDEVTVSFDASHEHFNEYDAGIDWSVEADRSGALPAIQLVRELLEERKAAISWWKGEEWRGSSWIAAEELAEGRIREPQFPSGYQTGHDRVRIRSWHGSWDADLFAGHSPGLLTPGAVE